MSLVSSSRAGTCRAERAFLMAPLIFATNSGQKGFPGAIFKNKITRSSPSALYWGTQRLSDTSSNASTAQRRGKERAEWRTRRKSKKNDQSRWETRRHEAVRGKENKAAKIKRLEKRIRFWRVWGNWWKESKSKRSFWCLGVFVTFCKLNKQWQVTKLKKSRWWKGYFTIPT